MVRLASTFCPRALIRLSLSALGVMLAGLSSPGAPPDVCQAAEPGRAGVIERVALPLQQSGSGELALIDQQGQIKRLITGFRRPFHISRSGPTSLLVVDQGACQVLELDEAGRLLWQWHVPSVDPFYATPLPQGNVLVVCVRGVWEVQRSGAILWSASAPPDHALLSAVRLADGSTLVSMQNKTPLMKTSREGELMLIPAGQATGPELDVPFEVHRNSRYLRLAPGDAEGETFLLWDAGWEHVYRCRLVNGQLEEVGKFKASQLAFCTADGAGGIFYAHALEPLIGQVRADGSEWSIVPNLLPAFLIPAATTGLYYTAWTQVPESSWPEVRRKPPLVATIHWGHLMTWWVATLLLLALVQCLAWWWLAARPRAADSLSGVMPEPIDRLQSLSRSARVGLTLLAIILAGVGLGLAGFGQSMVLGGFRPGWAWVYGGGVGLCVLVLESWRRWRRPGLVPSWQAVRKARPQLAALWPAWLAGGALLLGGCVLLLAWFRADFDYTQRIGLWSSLVLFSIGLACLTRRPPWRWRFKWPWPDLACLALILIVASLTFGYRLTDFPYDSHFDYGHYNKNACDLMDGYFTDIWQYGFVPAPVIGLWPQCLGIWLGGTTPLGFRLGGFLLSLTAPLAVYLLGRAYWDRRVGLLAGLLLAGNVSYLHYARLPTNGEAATAALWTITLFVLAYRSAWPGLWLATGSVAGYCFYLWAGAISGPVAIFLGYLALVLRDLRVALRRWYGPLLLALAALVWLIPLVPNWMAQPDKINTRPATFMAYKADTGINWPVVSNTLGQPWRDSVGWFFHATDKGSQWGSVSPGCNAVEAVLLAVGIGLVVVEGGGFNLVFLVAGMLVLVVGGSWTDQQPWSARLLPAMPIATVLMARTLVALLDLLAGTPRIMRQVVLGLLVVAVIWASPWRNWQTYTHYESSVRETKGLTGIGRRLFELGSRYKVFMVAINQQGWTTDYPFSRFYEMLCFVWNMHVQDVRNDVRNYLPLPADQPGVFVIQPSRQDRDVPVIKEYHPDARVEEIKDHTGILKGVLVIVDRPDPA